MVLYRAGQRVSVRVLWRTRLRAKGSRLYRKGFYVRGERDGIPRNARRHNLFQCTILLSGCQVGMLRLGECKLVHEEQPEQAMWHFAEYSRGVGFQFKPTGTITVFDDYQALPSFSF